MKEMLEPALIKALKNNDLRVYESTQEKYQDMVYLIINGYVKNTKHAKDLTQEVFTALWLNRKQLDTSKTLRSYLATMAHNKCKDIKRKQLTQRKFTAEYIRGLRQHYLLNQSLEEEELLKLIHQAISFITAKRRREVVYMTIIGMKNNKEIAEELQITPQVVRNQLCAGLKIVQEKLIELRKY